MKLTTRILTSATELEAFAKTFEAMGGTAVPIDYLRQSRPRGFFRGSELVAGYVLNTKAPFRYASWIPEGPRGEIAPRGFLVEPTSAELTCIWMAKGKLTKLERDNVYVRSGIDAFRSGKRFVFGGSRVDALARSQKRVLSNTIYSGRATFNAPCEIYYAPRGMMVFNMIAAAFATYAQDLGRLASQRLSRVASPN
jgi:hypothetical protein